MPFGSRFVSGTIAIAMAIGFAALGWWLWHSFVPTHPVAAHLYGFVVVATGALGLCLALRNLIRPVPFAIQISDKGITAYRGRSPDFILWSDIKGAHAAVESSQRVSVPIVALELVDPRSFYARLDADKPRWLGPDTGLRPKYYALASTGLDMEPEQMLLAVNEAIRRWGTADSDPSPETNFQALFTRLPGRAPFAIGLVLLVVLLPHPSPFSVRRAGSKRLRIAKCAIGTAVGSGDARKRRPSPGRDRASMAALKVWVSSHGFGMAF